MTDISPTFNNVLTKLNAQPVPPGRRRRSLKDDFMKEAYTIDKNITTLTHDLLSIRAAYLSTARPPRHTSATSSTTTRRYFTDKERDDVDFQAKTMIRQFIAVISNLEAVEKQRSLVEAKARKHTVLSFAGWIKDLRRSDSEIEPDEEGPKYLSMHREGVIWLLRRKLEKLSDVQREQQETRVMRSIEKNKSVLQNSGMGAGGGGITPAQAKAAVAASKQAQGHDRQGRYKRSYLPPEEMEEQDVEQVLSEEQLQIFAREGQDLLKQYEETLDQVRTAEKSLLEISELQTQLASNLAVQSTYMDQLYSDSITTAEHIAAGNKELKKAAAAPSMARRVFQFSVGISIFFIVADLVI